MAVITRFSGDKRIDAILRYIYSELNKIKPTSTGGADSDALIRFNTSLQTLTNRLSRLERNPASSTTIVIPYTHTKTSTTSISLGILSTRVVNTYNLTVTPLVKTTVTYNTEAEFLGVFSA